MKYSEEGKNLNSGKGEVLSITGGREAEAFDSVRLGTTVYFDDELMLENGEFYPEELKKLQKALGR